MKAKKSQILKYFWSHAKKYPISLVLQYLSNFATIILGFILIPIFSKEFFDLMINFSGSEREILQNDLFRILLMIVGLDLAAFVLFGRIADFSISHFQCRIMRDITNDCFDKLQQHSYHFFANHFVGGIVSKVNRLVRSFERIADILIFNLFPNLIRITFTIGVLFFFIPTVAWVLIGWTIFYTSTTYLFARWKMKYDLQNATADTMVTANLADSLSNALNVKMFARFLFEKARFYGKTDEQLQIRKFTWNLGNISGAIQSFFMITLEAIALYFLMKAWINGTISIGTIVMTQSYLIGIYINLWDFGRVIKDIHTSLADSEEMILIMNQTPDILDPKKPEKCSIASGKIEFQNVDFIYEKKTKVFENFNLRIKPGERIGIVGESGGGKSTFTKILLRFSDLSKGKILIDGQNITKIKQSDLRNNISYVPQESILFHRSLLENIRYGRLDATDEEVHAASRMANAHDFILNTPEGYQTMVGERGIKLSGGERQRVAIARAMIKNAPILILDEATSSLDSKSEKLIQQALDRLMKRKTVIVIAHRLSTIQKLDRIIVLEDGKIIESGSHNELIRKNGKYAELWRHQAGGFLE